MKRKWMAALVAFAALTLFAGAQDVLAAEKTMKIKVPGCV
jgi:hypothetical protein